MSSSPSRNVSKTVKGFSHQEITNLQNQGAGMSVGMMGQEITTPEQKRRTNHRLISGRGAFRSSRVTTGTSGFMGQMSSMKQEDVQRLVDSVRRRRSTIQEQARRPGRRQLMAGS